jgi:hypothetical protein
MKNSTVHAFTGVIFSLLAFVPNNLVPLAPVALAQESIPAAEVVWDHVGRVYLNPNTGKAVYAGYLVHLNGIGSSLFNGSPSEASAYLTFSTDVLQLTPMPKNGDIALSLVSAGTFNVYFNATPNGDWSNPATFSSGQLIATFARKESLFPEIGTMGFHSLSESLLSSRSFKWNGQTFNFNRIAPHGITFAQFFSTTLLPGITDYPVAFAAAGTTMAVGGSRPAEGPKEGKNSDCSMPRMGSRQGRSACFTNYAEGLSQVGLVRRFKLSHRISMALER